MCFHVKKGIAYIVRMCPSFSFRDFDASLYLCEEAFGLLPLDTFDRLAATLLLYPYLCTLLVLSVMLALAALTNLRYPHKHISLFADVQSDLTPIVSH